MLFSDNKKQFVVVYHIFQFFYILENRKQVGEPIQFFSLVPIGQWKSILFLNTAPGNSMLI